jgi:hypothetical protein
VRQRIKRAYKGVLGDGRIKFNLFIQAAQIAFPQGDFKAFINALSEGANVAIACTTCHDGSLEDFGLRLECFYLRVFPLF